jgi:UDP-N-acetylmuramoylalanine-D-glutamate ligase
MSDSTSTLCRGKRFIVSASDGAGSIATINWLLDHGAQVTVQGVAAVSDVQKKVHDHIKRTAADGDAYTKTLARLSWDPKGTAPVSDMRGLFLNSWKRTIIGITGAYGKTMTAVWATHLIGDAVVAGHVPERPLVPALDSKARVAVVVLDDNVSPGRRTYIVSTDDMPNIEAAQHAARLAGVTDAQIRQRMETLPQVPLRQEVVHRSTKLTVVNDAMSTQPAHGVAALRRWGGPTCVMICGGEGGNHDYAQFADELARSVRRTNMIFLTGSATRKVRSALGDAGRGIRAYDSLAAAFKVARARAGLYVSSVILFSPAATGGSLSVDAYERGRQLNALVDRYCRGGRV